MTDERKNKVIDVARELKGLLVGFTGSITYNFSANTDDVKIEIKEMGIWKDEHEQ
jgi:hypothetical protein